MSYLGDWHHDFTDDPAAILNRTLISHVDVGMLTVRDSWQGS